MRTIPAGFLDGSLTNLQPCWEIVKRNNEVIRGTESDIDVTITTGVYAGVYPARAAITGSEVHSTDDMAVDNLEVKGALVDSSGLFDTGTGDLTVPDLSAADIEAGLFDNAEAATFMVNVTNPDLYQYTLRSGWIGNVTRTSDGDYTAEMRGLTQALSQTIVRTYGVACDAELGDARCKVDLTAWRENAFVTVVETQRRAFQIDHAIFPTAFTHVAGGKVTFTTGANAGYSMEIKSYLSLVITLWRPLPLDIELGDEFTVQIGCDKAMMTCINTFNNFNNFRGYGIYVPGDHEVLKVGKR